MVRPLNTKPKMERPSLKQKLAEKLILFVSEDPGRSSKAGQNASFGKSLRNALKGLVFAFLSQRNFRFELLVFLLVIVFSVFMGLGPLEWAMVLQSGFLVLIMEAKNTALELSVDLSTTDYHYGAKGSKDAASGAVLLSAFNALAVGGFVFWPRIWVAIAKIVQEAVP